MRVRERESVRVRKLEREMKTVADCQISSTRKKEKYTERGRERKTKREMDDGKRITLKIEVEERRRKIEERARKGRTLRVREREKRCDEGFKKEIGRKKFRE